MRDRRGIALFRHEDAPDLDATDMMSTPTFSEDFVRPQNADTAAVVAGQSVKVLYRQSDEEGGFSLVYASVQTSLLPAAPQSRCRLPVLRDRRDSCY